jgi:hypothetical protein
MASEQMGFDRAELRQVFTALKAMGDAAKEEAKRDSNALAEYAQKQISVAATTRGKAANKIATGSKVKKSSTTGEITYGYASQKLSGGGDTKKIWGGTEFGSNKYRQFPIWSGRLGPGSGSKGWFIYPTLRKIQPYIVDQWTESFDKILKRWA